MRRREIFVFTAAFVVVLLGGAALAQVGTFSSSPATDAAALSESAATDDVGSLEETTTTSAPTSTTTAAAEEKPPEAIAEEGDDKEPSDPPKDDEPPADPPKDDEPPADADTTPPPLAILFPENEQHFEDKVVAFEGETEPGALVFGGNYEADVDSEGNWRVVLVLSPGGNTVTFKAKDAAGNTTKKSIKVYLDAEEVKDREFTANQKWEVFDGYPPKNKYYGTGTPGTTVWVGSAYGDGSAKIDTNGEWRFYVEFPNAPCNEQFTVVVENESNRREFKTEWVCSTNEWSVTHKYAENTSLWTKFYGTGNPGDTVWAVSEYGEAQTTIEGNGEFFLKLHFSDDLPANDEVKVVIESSSGNRAEFWFIWVVEEKEEVTFTANQKYGSCDEAVPYDKFFGTAAPGSTIWIESPYGGGTTVADSDGNWLLRVEFPDAPVDEAFTVVIESSDGGRAVFSFIRYAHG
ncbi:MAG: hypothetical protein GY722_29570 [bacterium]|nr:hypothetical protein [bacterium]